MKKRIVIILIISMISFFFYGCVSQKSDSVQHNIENKIAQEIDYVNNNTDNPITEKPEESEDVIDNSVKQKSTLPQDTNNDSTIQEQVLPENDAGSLIIERIKLFYGDEKNKRMLIEEREITYKKDNEKYIIVLEELIKGPNNEKYTANINYKTKIYGVTKQNKDLIVNLSREFNYFSGITAEILGVSTLVNTMTQFEEIERVKILLDGKEFIGLSSQLKGFMKEFPLSSKGRTNKEVKLYFESKEGLFLVPEKRNISVLSNIKEQDYVKKVLEELIKGPKEEGVKPTMPKEIKVISVTIKDGVAYVDFSEEIYIKYWGAAAEKNITIKSIVNTLTQFNYISKVKLTVKGKPFL